MGLLTSFKNWIKKGKEEYRELKEQELKDKLAVYNLYLYPDDDQAYETAHCSWEYEIAWILKTIYLKDRERAVAKIILSNGVVIGQQELARVAEESDLISGHPFPDKPDVLLYSSNLPLTMKAELFLDKCGPARILFQDEEFLRRLGIDYTTVIQYNLDSRHKGDIPLRMASMYGIPTIFKLVKYMSHLQKGELVVTIMNNPFRGEDFYKVNVLRYYLDRGTFLYGIVNGVLWEALKSERSGKYELRAILDEDEKRSICLDLQAIGTRRLLVSSVDPALIESVNFQEYASEYIQIVS